MFTEIKNLYELNERINVPYSVCTAAALKLDVKLKFKFNLILLKNQTLCISPLNNIYICLISFSLYVYETNDYINVYNKTS